MSPSESVTYPFSGFRGRWPIPEKPAPTPEAVRQLLTKVEQRRGKDIWRATQRLKVAAFVWSRFVLFGLLRQRLDDFTEDAVVKWFPELVDIGRVLNLWADEVTWPPPVLDLLVEFEKAHNVSRARTERHREDQLLDSCRAVQPLLTNFRRLMIVEADSLFRQQINCEYFSRPWQDIRTEIERFTDLCGDWTATPPQLHFAEMFKRREFLHVASRISCEMQELLDQLEQYPQGVLARPVATQLTRQAPRRPKQGLGKDEANIAVREFLAKDPDATSRRIAQQIGCSQGLVRGTFAWKNRPSANKCGRGNKALKKKVGVDKALKQTSFAEYQSGLREQATGDESNPLSGAAQLQDLIAEQQQDEKSDNRRRRS